MKYLNKKRLARVLLLFLLYSPFVVAQPYLTCLTWEGKSYNNLETNVVGFIINDGYYNAELIEKLKSPPYFPTYNYGFTWFIGMEYYIFLDIAGNPEDINLLDHYLKFEKEEFVKKISPYTSDIILLPPDSSWYSTIKGQILKNGVPLTNHIVNLKYTQGGSVYNSITDENGNYIFPDMLKTVTYTLYFKDEGITYNTTFVLDGNKNINFNDNVLVSVNYLKEISGNYNLSQNYPNPFNPTTTIQYSIPKNGYVKLIVYDIAGSPVKELVNGYKTEGKYNVEFNASNYASGIYYYRLEAGAYKSVRKMMLIK